MIKLSATELEYINFFEKKTKAVIKDCILNRENGDITIITKEGDIGLVIGKKGNVIKRLKKELGKEIHVYEYSDDPVQLIKNLLYPINVEKVEINDKIATVHTSQEERKRAIGRNGKKINMVKEITRRYFDIEDIRVV
ncbi:NusA-like transcription termination signal-binding factor [Candidatus Micrarchaeota archaeon]|nr:MAG: NusA-like transcription termination signal-binding factor [Candidatus Micrarchaeota archaeon]